MQSMCGFLKMEWWRFPVRTRLIERLSLQKEYWVEY